MNETSGRTVKSILPHSNCFYELTVHIGKYLTPSK